MSRSVFRRIRKLFCFCGTFRKDYRFHPKTAMADVVVDNFLLQSTLEIDNKPHHVKLTPKHMLWGLTQNRWGYDSPSSEPFLSYHNHSNIVELKDIFAVRVEQSKKINDGDFKSASGFPKSSKQKTPLYIEMQDLRPRSFSVHLLKRCKWRLKSRRLIFTCKDYYSCQQWVSKLKDCISNPAFKRPKSLLVFVNPFGGKKKGPKIYTEKIAPLFDLAEIKTIVITTERPNHAREYLEHFDLSRVDGVIVVGGDGMFSEVLNGLLDRRLRDGGLKQTKEVQPLKPHLRVGIIPAGSTDTIVFTSTGINDPVTSALHIILGANVGIDVCSLYCKDQFLRYSVSFLSYGYYGDMLKDSEKNRWMGPARYQLSGAKKFLSKNVYEGEVSFLLASDSLTGPRDKYPCLSGCNVCSLAGSKATESRLQSQGHTHRNKYCSTAASIEQDHSAIVSSSSDVWHKISGRFVAISNLTMSCRCALCPNGVSPSTHLGDGTSDLMLISECSRVDFLRHLYRCQDKTADQFDFDFVQVYRVKEFNFNPKYAKEQEVESDEEKGTNSNQPSKGKTKSKSSPHSVWNCDGEVLEQQNLHVRIHCQLIDIFAPGIVEPGPSIQCRSCCSSCDKEIDEL